MFRGAETMQLNSRLADSRDWAASRNNSVPHYKGCVSLEMAFEDTLKTIMNELNIQLLHS